MIMQKINQIFDEVQAEQGLNVSESHVSKVVDIQKSGSLGQQSLP